MGVCREQMKKYLLKFLTKEHLKRGLKAPRMETIMKVMTTATKNTIIRMLGNLHYGKSDWQAIEFVFSKMSKAQKDLLKPRQVKALEKFITKEHQRNYFEYRQIMGGNW